MNARIQEFAKLAQANAEWMTPQGLEWFDNFKQQFAKLIVRECAQVCNNIDAEYEGGDVLATWCATAIKEHFGVEE